MGFDEKGILFRCCKGLIEKPATIIAIDQSREMLSQMKIKMRDSSRIDYRVGNANHLPVRDNIVDFALANMYLHHVDNPQKALGEIYRILNSGGTLILTDLESHKFKFLMDEHHDKWLGFKHKEIRDWLKGIGFINVSVSPLEEYCCSTSVSKNKHAKISIFLATGQKP